MVRSGSNVKIKNLITVLTVCIVSTLMLFSTRSVSAAGFINHNDSIYTQTAPETTTAAEETTTEQAYNGEFDQEEEPSIAEKTIGGLFYGVANGIHSALEKMKLDIDTAILGRLSYDNNEPSLLRFEFAKGNVYGIMSMLIYSSIRAIIYVLLAISVAFLIVKHIFKNTSRSREEFKGELVGVLSMFLVLGVMPYFWDLTIFLRDVLLSALRDDLTAAIGCEGLSLWDTLSFAYEQSGGRIVPASLCLGSAFLTVMFIFAYALITMTDVILCVAFPFICLYGGEKRKRAVENWISMAFANLIIPVVDYILIMLVAAISIINGNSLAVSVVQLFFAWNILKAREQILIILQLRSSQAGALGGLMGMMAAGRLLRGAVSNARGVAENVGSAYSDYRDGKMEEELDSLGKDEYGYESGVTNDDSDENNARNPYENDEDVNESPYASYESEGDEADEQGADGIEYDNPEQNVDNQDEDKEDEQPDGDAENANEDNDEAINDSEQDSAMNPDSEKSDRDKIDALESDNDAMAMENGQIDKQLDHDRDSINRNNDEIEKLNDENERDQAKLDEMMSGGEDNPEKEQKLKSNISRRQGRIETLQGRNADLSARVSGLKARKMENLSKMRANNNAIYETRSAMSALGSYGGRFTGGYDPSTATEQERRMHDIVMKRVDIRNFDSPKFEGMLSHKEMSDFYKQRARRNIAKAGVKVAVGGVGAAMGAATMSWMGPAYTAYGMSAGMSAGTTFGDASVDALAGMYKGSRNLYGKIKGRAQSGKGNKRDIGTEHYPNEQIEYLANSSMGEKIPSFAIDYEPEEIINMEGSFMQPGDARAAVERSKTAKTALKYTELNAVRKKQLMRSINLNIETAIRNKGITENEVPEYIMRRYSGGIDELTAGEQQKVRDFIEEVIGNWNNR